MVTNNFATYMRRLKIEAFKLQSCQFFKMKIQIFVTLTSLVKHLHFNNFIFRNLKVCFVLQNGGGCRKEWCVEGGVNYNRAHLWKYWHRPGSSRSRQGVQVHYCHARENEQ